MHHGDTDISEGMGPGNGGARGPDWRTSARVLAESGFMVVIIEKRNEPLHVGFSCDNDNELLACAWLLPGVDDDGPLH